uniref:Ubiquitin-conjugating enzyme E2 G1 n=1 Tax=Ornithorhynchus anatinus TaxID=9258 RepID=A0A6I8NT23_ORNAN
MTELQSALLLRRQLAELNKNPVEGFSAGLIDDNDLYRWEVLIIGPPDTLYEGGVFKAHLTFPKDYPLRPPKMKFITEIWHPNVDKNGDVCISILHEPGEDKYGYEKPEERWLPIHTVETIMISVISMLADPNGDSPANVDAAVRGRAPLSLLLENPSAGGGEPNPVEKGGRLKERLGRRSGHWGTPLRRWVALDPGQRDSGGSCGCGEGLWRATWERRGGQRVVSSAVGGFLYDIEAWWGQSGNVESMVSGEI